MSKLCQIIAVANGMKTGAERTITDIHRRTEKDTLLIGHDRTYQPKLDGGETLPPERKVVQVKVPEAMQDAQTILRELWKIVGIQDLGNTKAKADIVLKDGTVLAKEIPVTHLLFLEKQLDNIGKLVSSLAVLDPAQEWGYDANKDAYVSKPIQTLRTKKTQIPLTLAPATDKHPAQVKDITDDVVVGTWTQVNYSGGIPAKAKKDMMARIEDVRNAVKFAREKANQQEVEDNIDLNGGMLNYVFAPVVQSKK